MYRSLCVCVCVRASFITLCACRTSHSQWMRRKDDDVTSRNSASSRRGCMLMSNYTWPVGWRVRVPSATGIIRQRCRSPTKWTVDIGFTLALLVHTLTKCCWHSKVNSEDVCSAQYVVFYRSSQTGNHGLLFKDALAFFFKMVIGWVLRVVYELWGVRCSLGHKLYYAQGLTVQALCNVADTSGTYSYVLVCIELLLVT